jgi:calcium permeable stress-gated cation channel
VLQPQRDLEYDPTLYQRDRGELDWDQRSIGTTAVLAGDGSSINPTKSAYYANPSGRGSPAPPYGRASPAPSAYDRYSSRGPMHHPNASGEIELARIDTNADQLPLLMSQQGYFDGAPPRPVSGQHYQQSSPGRATPPPGAPRMSPSGQYPPAPMMYRNEGDSYREAPLHRPFPHQQSSLSLQSRQAPSSYSAPQPPHSRTPSAYSSLQGGDAQNIAGRGTYRQ